MADYIELAKTIIDKLLSKETALTALVGVLLTPEAYDVLSNLGVFSKLFYKKFGSNAELAISFSCSLAIALVSLQIIPVAKAIWRVCKERLQNLQLEQQIANLLSKENRLLMEYWIKGDVLIAEKKSLTTFESLRKRGFLEKSPYFDGAYVLSKPAKRLLRNKPWLIAPYEDLEYFASVLGYDDILSIKTRNIAERNYADPKFMKQYVKRHPHRQTEDFIDQLKLVREDVDRSLENSYPNGVLLQIPPSGLASQVRMWLRSCQNAIGGFLQSDKREPPQDTQHESNQDTTRERNDEQ